MVKFPVHEAKAEVNLQLQGLHGSALAVAASTRRLDIVEYLVVQAKADVNIHFTHGRCGSVLATAAAFKRLENVKYLVDKAGGKVNMPLKHALYGSVLAFAACSDDENVRFFVKEAGPDINIAGADVNMQLLHGQSGSALEAAMGSIGPDLDDIVKFLVERANADIAMLQVSGRFQSPLMAAMVDGRDDVVECLLQFKKQMEEE